MISIHRDHKRQKMTTEKLNTTTKKHKPEWLKWDSNSSQTWKMTKEWQNYYAGMQNVQNKHNLGQTIQNGWRDTKQVKKGAEVL